MRVTRMTRLWQNRWFAKTLRTWSLIGFYIAGQLNFLSCVGLCGFKMRKTSEGGMFDPLSSSHLVRMPITVLPCCKPRKILQGFKSSLVTPSPDFIKITIFVMTLLYFVACAHQLPRYLSICRTLTFQIVGVLSFDLRC